MQHVDEMDTFVRVVAQRSFSAAANELGLSPASVTRRISLLEQRLGVKLLNRNTRRLSVTDAGERYALFAERIVREVKQEELVLGRLNREAGGDLKVVVSKSFGNLHMGQAIAEFIGRYPKIHISVVVSDVSLNSLDPIEHGFDLAVRLGEPGNTRLFSRRIGTAHWVACAAPAYIRRAGEPRIPEDLLQHACVTHQLYMPNGNWEFRNSDGIETVKVPSLITTNSVMVARHVAVSGLGVALLPTYCAGADLQDGRLHQVLGRYSLASQTIRALYPHSSLQPRKVKLFVDFLRQRFKAADWH